LDAVQSNHFFQDSKHFVDKPLTVSPATATAAFQALPQRQGQPTKYKNSTLLGFLQDNFGPPGSELTPAHADDFNATLPNFLPLVQSAPVRQWALDVHQLWNDLYRVENRSVVESPDRHSLLPIPYGVVVPGARFRELYYWDSYWILKGLLVSQMNTTAENMCFNLLSLLETYGHIPNGARTYYLNRSQPPLMSAMIKIVYAATQNRTLLTSALPLLIQEHKYWMSAPKLVRVRAANGTSNTVYNLSRYHAEWNLPRPESYNEDVATADGLDGAAKEQLYTDLASGAESGWDFSSRWLADGTNLSTIRTTQIVPTDLNSYLYDMERNIADFAIVLDDAENATRFSALAAQRHEAIQALMWDGSTGQWRDLVISGSASGGVSLVERNPGTSVSNFIPLWVGVAPPEGPQALAALAAFRRSGLLGPAGVATTNTTTGQQWDAPNAWPPLQDIVIEALENYGGAEGRQLAASIAQRWLLTMFESWSSAGTKFFHKMVEKYDATALGVSGGGGEYSVQSGFGWTNGVMLSLLDRYGWDTSAYTPPAGNATTAAPTSG
jgi:alpha,alpha-trehalase